MVFSGQDFYNPNLSGFLPLVLLHQEVVSPAKQKEEKFVDKMYFISLMWSNCPFSFLESSY